MTNCDRQDAQKKLRCIELYSGIGGMHCALKASGIPFEVVMAADVNTVTNSVYQYNFSETRLFKKCLTTLTIEDIENCQSDMILMSPPCQPYTRVGKKMDMEDERSKSFLHILQLLPKISKKPDYILLENVQGFEQSSSRRELLHVLNNLDFVVQEFMLTPFQFGIPNSRLRYYMVAKRCPLKFNFSVSSEINYAFPDVSSIVEVVRNDYISSPLLNFLEAESMTYFNQFMVPQRLFKYFWVMDIVTDKSECTCCFTKRYGRMMQGSGSVIQMSAVETDLSAFRDPALLYKSSADFHSAVAALQLRFFTPREIANLLCFPAEFGFPCSLSTIQLYRILGNSLNVKIMSSLLKILTLGDELLSIPNSNLQKV